MRWLFCFLCFSLANSVLSPFKQARENYYTYRKLKLYFRQKQSLKYSNDILSSLPCDFTFWEIVWFQFFFTPLSTHDSINVLYVSVMYLRVWNPNINGFYFLTSNDLRIPINISQCCFLCCNWNGLSRTSAVKGRWPSKCIGYFRDMLLDALKKS